LTRNYIFATAVYLHESHRWKANNVVTSTDPESYSWVFEISIPDGTDPSEVREVVDDGLWSMRALELAGDWAEPEEVEAILAGSGYQRAEAAAIVARHRKAIAELLGLPVPKRDPHNPPPMTLVGQMAVATAGERVRLVIDGIPYAAAVSMLPIHSAGPETNLKPGVELVVLMEDVGQHTSRVLGREGLVCYMAGALLFAHPKGGEFHEGTGERLYDHIADMREATVGPAGGW
jgi:hypothetical protein